MGSYSNGQQAQEVVVIGHIAYVAYGFGGLVMLDVSNPYDPQLLGYMIHPGLRECCHSR